MPIIDSPTKSLVIVLGATPTTQLIWNVSLIDTVIPKSIDGITNSTTPVVMVSGLPTTSNRTNKTINEITVFNCDDSAQLVSVYLLNSEIQTIVSVNLNVGYTLHYDASGWYVTDTTGSRTTTSISLITVGDPVIGGTSKALLYKDADGNLASSILKQEEDGITLPDGKWIMSATPNKSSLSFGENGNSFYFYTDGIALGSETQVVWTPATVTFATITGRYTNGNNGTEINHNKQIDIDITETPESPSQINIGLANALVIIIGNTTSSTTLWGTINIHDLTASTVPYLDASKNLVSSSVTPTQLSYLDATSSIQTQLNGKAAAANGTPSIAAGAGAGTSPTVSVTGTDGSMKISITTGTLPTLSAVVATITFGSAFTGTPTVVFSAANGNASILSGAGAIFMVAPNAATFTITAGTTALIGATAYLWNVHVLK